MKKHPITEPEFTTLNTWGILIVLLSVTMLSPTTFLPAEIPSGEYIRHAIAATLDPAEGAIEVEDVITVPARFMNQPLTFLLHGGLSILESENAGLKKTGAPADADFAGINAPRFAAGKDFPVSCYLVTPSQPAPASGAPFTFKIRYRGIIRHEIKASAEEYARGFSETPGVISPEGVYLAGSSFWIPRFNGEPVVFSMTAAAPLGWTSISQGSETPAPVWPEKAVNVWGSPEPTEEVYLIAAPWKKYEKRARNVLLQAFLRTPDEPLAEKYLDVTTQYLEMYEKLIGPYPYPKFALVENFWETGYGMPSFTLLGSKIIRFPFILHSSYPHELLHNWWGNGVFSDYAAGNWCEGLTVYLADHLIKEQRGQGDEYRRDLLQQYTHYAAGKPGEIPLTRFTARFNPLTSSVGYGKSMMVFHMLRQMLGDEAFIRGIRLFYSSRRFKRATFADLSQSFSEASGKDLTGFFRVWTERVGAPTLQIRNVSTSMAASPSAASGNANRQSPQYVLTFTLEQLQAGEPFPLNVPVAARLEGASAPFLATVELTGKTQDYALLLPSAPLSVQADPQWDVFRTLHASEVPPSLSAAFGADRLIVALPSRASAPMAAAYRQLAESWRRDYGERLTIIQDSEMDALPGDAALWLLGAENIHLEKIKKTLRQYGAIRGENAESLELNGETFSPADKCLVTAVNSPFHPVYPIVWLSSPSPEALPGLGRKVPHYGKYSFLAFSGAEPENIAKGQWPAPGSPLKVRLTDAQPPSDSWPKRSALAELPALFNAERMQNDINRLASEEMEGRGIGSKGIEKAAHYIAVAFRDAGLTPGGDNNSFIQAWETEALVGKNRVKILAKNIIGVIPGTEPKYRGERVIVCAHYDHLGLGWPQTRPEFEGKIHYGANDNASGAAVLLELARIMAKDAKPERTIVFIAFTGEESGLIGSRHYIQQLERQEPGAVKKIMATVNIDTVGQLKEGEKLLIFGGSSAREWRFLFMGVNYTTGVDNQLVAQDIEAGDHVAFIEKGVPAVHLCSGASPGYHTPADRPETIYAPGLTKTAATARETLVYLAGRPAPLTFTGAGSASASQGTSTPSPATTPPHAGARSPRTGVTPDFSYDGAGVRAADIAPGSPADKAGLKKGDIITNLAGQPVANLREYANILKSRQPGEKIPVTFIRDGQSQTTEVELPAR